MSAAVEQTVKLVFLTHEPVEPSTVSAAEVAEVVRETNEALLASPWVSDKVKAAIRARSAKDSNDGAQSPSE